MHWLAGPAFHMTGKPYAHAQCAVHHAAIVNNSSCASNYCSAVLRHWIRPQNCTKGPIPALAGAARSQLRLRHRLA